MTVAIKNGFKRCGLFPFDPNNVDYTKCVKNTLEQQHTLNSTRIAENEVIFTHADFRVAENIIEKIGSNLESYGISPQVILNEIKFFENEGMQESNGSVETFVADVKQVASSISVDPIMDISVTEDVILNEPEIEPSIQISTVVDKEKIVSNISSNTLEVINGEVNILINV